MYKQAMMVTASGRLRMLFEDLADEPLVPKWVDHGTLQHLLDGAGSGHRIAVFDHQASAGSPRANRARVDRDGIVDEELDPDGGETGASRSAGSGIGGFIG